MAIWIVFAFLAAAAVAALAWPLLVGRPGPASRAGYDQAVFRDQLAELERDQARGLIGTVEAEAARNEIARRLLAVSDAAETPAGSGRRLQLAALAAVPALALGLYAATGNPHLPDVPRQERLAAALETQDMPALVAKVEDHLAANPDDIEGWSVLAPSYRKMERYEEAANAYAQLLRLAQPSAGLLADYGEMLVLANRGLATAEASRAFAQAMTLDAKHPKARY
jgi:cytochrome c-type biogenesis protein CcmH